MARASSILSPLIPPCTCARQPPRRYASLRAGTATPPPHLDFLYPTFGFFSRSLPGPAPSPPKFVAPSPSSHSFSRTLRGAYGTALGGRAAKVKWDDCVCGRAVFSCLRCRPSSSAAGSVAQEESVEVDEIQAPSEVIPELPPADDPSPPPILSSDPPLAPSPRPASRRQLLQVMRKLDVSLPAARLQRDTRRSEPKLQSPRAVQASLLAPATALNGLEESANALWESLDVSQSDVAAISELTSTDQLDLIRLFARFVRAAPTLRSATALTTDDEAIELESMRDRLDQFRKVQGERIGVLLEKLSGPDHVRSRAALFLDSLALRDLLPEVPPPPSSDNLPDPFHAALSAVFQPATPSTPAEAVSISQSNLSTLSLLIESWERSPDGAYQALKLVVGWQLETALSLRGASTHETRYAEILRRAYGELLAKLPPSPSVWFAQETTPSDARVIGVHLIQNLSYTGASLEALQIRQSLARKGVRLSGDENVGVCIALMEGLFRDGFIEDANAVVRELDPSALIDDFATHALASQELRVKALKTAVKVVAQRGRMTKVDDWLARLESVGWQGDMEGAARQMRSHSERASLPGTRLVFDAPRGAEARAQATERDQARLYGELIRANVRVDDLKGGMAALERLIKEGLRPTRAIINSLMYGYAGRGDRERTYALFNRLGAFSLKADLVSYGALMSLHANLRDPEAAQRVIKMLEGDGLVANRRIWTTLMNGLVEVGSFSKAVDIFYFLKAHPDPAMQPDIATTNVLLKANVLLSTPAQSVLALFRRMLEGGLRPNAQTYTLLMQSVCTAGLMDIAEDLFTLMDRPSRDNSLNLPIPAVAIAPDAFTFSILIRGYLAKEDTTKARACLNEMMARGISPSSVTYGIIVGSYLRSDTADGLSLARSLAKEFITASPLASLKYSKPTRYDRPLARGQELLNVFGPIINAYAKRMDVVVAMDYFQQVLQQEVQPSIPLYTSLMDAYRGTRQLDSVRYLWNHIYQLVLDTHGTPSSDPTDSTVRIDADHRNVLCLPLSVLIDSLAATHRHAEIASTWQLLSSQGFAFDSSNWNSLAVALVDDGQLERAFWISECILCPAERDEEGMYHRTRGDIGGGGGVFNDSESVDVALRLPQRAYLYREGEVAAQRRSPTTILQAISPAPPLEEVDLVEEVEDIELIPSLFRAQEVLRSHYWFPHAMLLRSIERALVELSAQGGRKITRGNWRGNEVSERYETVLQDEEAEALSGRLRDEHPKTMMALRRRQDAVERNEERY